MGSPDISAGRPGGNDPCRKISPTRLAAAILLGFFLLSACSEAPVPLSDQKAVDLAGIRLPDTYPEGVPIHPRIVRVLRSRGFRWNNPRFTMGHHLDRENESAWFDRQGTLHITRYIGQFRETGYRIWRYVPSTPGDLEHRGTHIRPSIFLCLFNRPAEAARYHDRLNTMDLLTEVSLGVPVDLLLVPATLPICLLGDRLPKSFLKTDTDEDRREIARVQEAARQEASPQKGKPIPTKVTAPASVE